VNKDEINKPIYIDDSKKPIISATVAVVASVSSKEIEATLIPIKKQKIRPTPPPIQPFHTISAATSKPSTKHHLSLSNQLENLKNAGTDNFVLSVVIENPSAIEKSEPNDTVVNGLKKQSEAKAAVKFIAGTKKELHNEVDDEASYMSSIASSSFSGSVTSHLSNPAPAPAPPENRPSTKIGYLKIASPTKFKYKY
jgi:hypothetical protein